MDEYIKRSEVVDLIERKIKNCVTVPGAFVCASLRTAVMGLRPSDVAPRAEIAEEIFNEIAKMFSEKQRSYENSHQSGKARQMMVARFEVHKLHQKYKEAHNG